MTRRTSLVIGILLLVGVHAFFIAVGVNPLHEGGGWDHLWDSDSYTRILRVRELAAGAAWYDPTLRAANFPHGFPLHWSRLLDVIVLGPALLGSLVAPFPSALHAWSILLGPAMQVVALLLLSWGTSKFIGDKGFVLLAGLFVAQRGISYDFVAGIVDHHGLQVLCLIGALAAVHRSAEQPRLAYLAGAFGALGLWASAESIVLVLALVLGLAFHWILSGERTDALLLVRYGASLALGALVMLVCERGPRGLLEPSYERLSIVQVALAAAVLAGAAGILRASRSRAAGTSLKRLLVAGALSAAVLILLVGIFPSIVRNPYAATAAIVRERLLPLIPAEQLFLPTTPEFAYNFALEIVPGIIALSYCILRLARKSSLTPDQRLRYTVSAVALAAFLAYAIYAMRGLPFVGAVAIVPWAEAIFAAWRRVRDASRAGKGLRSLIPSVGVASVVSVGHAVAATAIALLWMPQFVVGRPSPCRWDVAAASIPPPPRGEPDGAILTDVFNGPEVAYRTGRPVLGAPYHDNGDGIEAIYRILESPPQDAIRLLDARRVRWIALCAWMGPDMQDIVGKSPRGFGAMLLDRRPPLGFTPIALPPEVDPYFVLYRRIEP